MPIIPNCMLSYRRPIVIDHLAHGAERGAAIRGECGEVLDHGGSGHAEE